MKLALTEGPSRLCLTQATAWPIYRIGHPQACTPRRASRKLPSPTDPMPLAR